MEENKLKETEKKAVKKKKIKYAPYQPIPKFAGMCKNC